MNTSQLKSNRFGRTFAAAMLSMLVTATAAGTASAADTTPPVARCKPYTLDVNCGQTILQPAMIDNGSTDEAGGSGIKSMSVSPNSFSCAQAGTQTVTLTVTDNAGNVSSCTTTLTVTCHRVSCRISVAPCASPNPDQIVAGPNSVPGSFYDATHPFYLYLGYGPQCVVLTGRGYGSNAYYSDCWSAAPGNPAPGGLSCYTCASPTFTPTVPGLYTFYYTTYGSPNADNGCTPTLCSSTCTVTICVKTIADALDFGPGNGVGNGYGNNGKGKDGYGNHDEGNNAERKVYICHVPAGNPGNTHVIFVSKSAASAHIGYHGGDYYYYGPCESPCAVAGTTITRQSRPAQVKAGFELSVSPNPSRTEFRVAISGAAGNPADVRIYDMQGRLVEQRLNIDAGAVLSVGERLSPGSYMIDVRCGTEVRKLPLIKL